jgi:molecular chaperone GrpE (heat shock protein)
MCESGEPKLAKWPFFLGNAVLLGAAWFIFLESKLPMGWWQTGFVILCVAGGACLAIMPFLLEYRVFVRLAEARNLATVVGQIKDLEAVAAQIGGATGQWQSIHEEAGKATASAKEISEKMTNEIRTFAGLFQRMNDAEKGALRLEVEKLRRVEGDWMQVLMRVLDHVYALNQAAVRSGQPALVKQIGYFEHSCRDAARRVGLAPFAAQESEVFDGKRHQVAGGNGNGAPKEGALVGETVLAGYTFQGKLVRLALVRLREPEVQAEPEAAGNGGTAESAEVGPGQSQMTLDVSR